MKINIKWLLSGHEMSVIRWTIKIKTDAANFISFATDASG